MNYPTFIIIGTMKGGTTSLYQYLATHPEVSVSRIKETNYFLGRHEYQRGSNWYSSLFNEGAKAIVEASPNYTKRHLWPGVAERMVKMLPDVKLIYVVRDPIRRILSHYVHNYVHGRERWPFSEVIVSKVEYIKTSMYAYQLEAFLDYFPLNRILIVDSDALRSETDKTLRNVFQFIGVRSDFKAPNVEEKFHVSANKLRRSALERHVKSPLLRRVLRPFLPSRLSDPQPFNRPVLSTGELDRLADALRPDIERFRTLTGMRFANWSV